MKRLTFKEPDGRWGIVGMDKPVCDIEGSIYSCLGKLLDYEELGLNPDNMEQKLMELRDYKETGFKPAEISELISSTEKIRTSFESLISRLEDVEENIQAVETLLKSKIHVGTVIQGYKVFGIVGNRCIAERINKIGCEDFVVWLIDDDGCGVNSGKYFSFMQFAKSYFTEFI